MNDVIAVILVGMPFLSLASTIFLWSLYRDLHNALSLMLALFATIDLASTTWFALLVVNTRFLGRVTPPELIVVTILAIIMPLLAINVISFVLWRMGSEKIT